MPVFATHTAMSLVVTEVAVADEINRGRRRSKGRADRDASGGGAWVHCPTTARRRRLLRPGASDLFWLGTAEALELGRQQAQLLRRSVRSLAPIRCRATRPRLRSPKVLHRASPTSPGH